ncbi:AI-2E family transporter [Kingella oralis]|jgi:hypothetical protein|uniref:hypothetical protein n=1 Tax=Kingella oralis TaxID=505 RepID=UPI0034E606CF
MSHNPPNAAAPQPANPPAPPNPSPVGNDTGKPFLISLAIAVLVLFGVLHFHFVVLFVSILMTYCLIEGANAMLGKALGGRLQHQHVHLISALSIVLAVCAMLGIAVYAGYTKINIDEFEAMYHRLPQILASYGADKYLPEGINIGEEISAFFAAHSANIMQAGKKGVTSFVYIIIGIIVGIMLKTHVVHSKQAQYTGFLSVSLVERLVGFKTSFKDVFVAQVKISTVNTLLTVLYLFVALPAAGIVSLIFLVVIHKAEYFLNAKIIGEQVNAKAFELLLVMIIFEHLFGIGGIVLAPVCYAYLKKELISHQIIG